VTEQLLRVELKILDPRLPGWGFPSRGSSLAAGLDLHACVDSPFVVKPQTPAILISAGFALRIDGADWCGLVVPRSGLGHKKGLVLGNTIGVIDADYGGPCLISAWNRNPAGEGIWIQPGDRIAQLVFVRIARPEFGIVPAFSKQEGRQEGGFGSTGVEPTCPSPRPARNL
jgi:dUTP pyrophosphatase